LNDLQDDVVAFIADRGGSVPYRDLYEYLEPHRRTRLRDALTALKSQNRVKQAVAFDAATSRNSHTVSLVRSGG